VNDVPACNLPLCYLPLEMLEIVLMRVFLMMYVRGFETDENVVGRRHRCAGRSRCAEWAAFIMLSSVCSYWHLTLTGWPQSPTSQWVKHKLRKMIEREYFVSQSVVYFILLHNFWISYNI